MNVCCISGREGEDRQLIPYTGHESSKRCVLSCDQLGTSQEEEWVPYIPLATYGLCKRRLEDINHRRSNS